MKKIIFVMLVLMTVVVCATASGRKTHGSTTSDAAVSGAGALDGPAYGTGNVDRGKASTRDVISLVRNYKHHDDFEVISVGKLGLSLAHMIANASADEDEKAALGILRDINKVVVVNYDEADVAKQQAFNVRMGKILYGAEKILEVKEEGETVNIYGTSVNGGESIDDLIIFIPEDCSLVCILGSISAERIADLIEKTNE